MTLRLQKADNPEGLRMGSAEIIFSEHVRKLGKYAQYLIKGKNRKCCVWKQDILNESIFKDTNPFLWNLDKFKQYTFFITVLSGIWIYIANL